MHTFRIFIGSSTESAKRKYLQAVEEAIKEDAIKNGDDSKSIRVHTWRDFDFFEPGNYIWDRLVSSAKEYDAAIFIFGPDDEINNPANDLSKITRDDNLPKKKTRDNVIMEFGLFYGLVKIPNSVAICKVGDVALPSDLGGKIYIKLRVDENSLDPLPDTGEFKSKIRKWISSLSLNPIIETHDLKRYYFIKFDIINSSYIYETNVDVKLRIFDHQLELFRSMLNKSNEFNGLDNVAYDDIYLYGLPTDNNKRLISIINYCSELLLGELDKQNNTIKQKLIEDYPGQKGFINDELKNIKVRVSVLSDDKSIVINSIPFSHFKGKAINISGRFKFFGNYNSLTIDEQVFDALGDANSDFTNLDLKIDNKEDFFGHKEILNKQILVYSREHLRKKEYVFASDFLLQYYLDEDNSPNEEVYTLVKETIAQLETQLTEEKNNDFESQVRIIYQPVRTIIQLLRCKYSMISKEHPMYKDYIKRTLTSIRSFLNELEKSPCHTHYWILYGLSPKNYFINLLLKNSLDEIHDTKGIHDGCSLCSSKNALCFGLLKSFTKDIGIDKKKFDAKVNQLNNFITSKNVQDSNFCVQNERDKDLHYLAYALQAAIVNKYPDELINNMLKHLNRMHNWLDHCESNSVRLRGLLFASLAILYKCRPDLLKDDYRKKFLSEFNKYINDSIAFTYQSNKASIPSPIVLDGIEGMLESIRLGLINWLQEDQDPSKTEDQLNTINKIIVDSYKASMDDTLWDKNGMWGYEKQRTYYRLSFWFKYWELQLANGKG